MTCDREVRLRACKVSFRGFRPHSNLWKNGENPPLFAQWVSTSFLFQVKCCSALRLFTLLKLLPRQLKIDYEKAKAFVHYISLQNLEFLHFLCPRKKHYLSLLRTLNNVCGIRDGRCGMTHVWHSSMKRRSHRPYRICATLFCSKTKGKTRKKALCISFFFFHFTDCFRNKKTFFYVFP